MDSCRPVRTIALAALLPLTVACSDRTPRGAVQALPDPGLDFIEEPSTRRAQCAGLRPTELTRQFDAAGGRLVACRTGYPAGFQLVSELGARQVGQTPNWTLYAVPVAAVPGG